MAKVAVIGAGEIGTGVAQSFAMNNYEVLLIDKDPEQLKNSLLKIEGNLRFASLYGQSVNQTEVLNKITTTTDRAEIRKAKIIVENISEDSSEKQILYEKIKKYIDATAVLMVNTSCIPIASLAKILPASERVIGVHFMNPVPMKEYVEVIQQESNSEKTVADVIDVLASIGKKAILVNDHPGFVSNRISHIFMNEAAFTLMDGVASAKNIDHIFKQCFGHKMGPLETADLIGIDTVVNSLNVLYEELGEDKYKCCPLLLEMVNEQKLGRKSGIGFYTYK